MFHVVRQAYTFFTDEKGVLVVTKMYYFLILKEDSFPRQTRD